MANNEFTTTRNLFASYTNYTRPLSYSEWLETADDCKVAVLFCQFFEQITLAWYKLKSVYSLDSDGVSEVLMYLNKNVPMIKADEDRFNPGYIYKVAYNCLYCLCRDMNVKKKVYENEVSNIVSSGEDELDLFNTVIDNESTEVFDMDDRRSEFWSIIESRGKDAIVVVAELLSDNVDWTDEDPDILMNGEEADMIWKHHKVTFTEKEVSKLRESSELIINTIDKLEDGKYRVEYEAWEARHYKGYKKFTRKDFESISDDRKVEILEDLRSVLEEFVDVFVN